MAKLRYVIPQDSETSTSKKSAGLNSTVRSIRAFYETDPEIAAALLPKPLKPAARPEIFVQFAQVAMQIKPDYIKEIGAVTVAVMCQYNDTRGGYVLAMPMEGEMVCMKGRETFGEPKKIAQVDFNFQEDRFNATCTRHGIPFIRIAGNIGASTGPKKLEEKFFCYKGMPAIQRGEGFDGDVFLTQLDWSRQYTDTKEVIGDIILQESPYDPLVDVPVRKINRIEYAEGSTITGGQILEKVPGKWLTPFLVHRYDDPRNQGIDIAVKGEEQHGTV